MHIKQEGSWRLSNFMWVSHGDRGRKAKTLPIRHRWSVKLFVIRQDYSSINPTWPNIQASINSARLLNEWARECLKLNAGSTSHSTNCIVKYKRRGSDASGTFDNLRRCVAHARFRVRESPFTSCSLPSFYRMIIKKCRDTKWQGAARTRKLT